jgi:glutamate synthase (NADPH/NADH) small chain
MAATLPGFDGAHPALPSERAELKFGDQKPLYSKAQAIAEASRCLYCHDAPCIQACPTSIDIPEFIRRIATGNVRGSAKVIFDSNILGMSCARVCPVEVLCVGKCVFNHEQIPPIQIGRLQRYATDTALKVGWTLYEPGPPSGRRVALVGGGPSSMACAHELRKYGHSVVVFEKRPLAGGLNTGGVAPYKMRADAGLAEVEWIVRTMGVELKTGVELGRDLTWDALIADFDAVFVGVGLGPDSRLGIPGEELPGVVGGVDVIERWKTGRGRSELLGVTQALVVGGGNTALDAVRELLGLGVPDVTLVYRRGEEQMPGYEHEWHYATAEGARASWKTLPLELLGGGAGGRVSGLRCARAEADPADGSGRTLRAVAGSDFVLPAQLVVVAAGQHKLEALLESIPGVEVKRGRLVVDKETGRTSNPKVWAGGDVANGGKEVVNAAAEGKRAALSIHGALSAT